MTRAGPARAGELHYPGAIDAQEEIVAKIITPPQAPPIMEIARELLPPGMELVVADPSKPEFYDAAVDADYYLGSPRTGIGNEFFRAAPKLKLVQLTSAGYDRVDLEAARKAKVPVANNGGANSVAVAEHAVMLMLAVLKKLVYHHLNVVNGTWRAGDFAALRTYEVEGKRLGIVGLGNIGKKVARRVQGFDMDVRYYDVLRLTENEEDALGVRFMLLNELLRTSDVVTLHVPLNDVTRKMMSTAQFAIMKKTAILINTCRGPVVDEDALHAALTSGTIAGAGLDVMMEEPPKKNHPLFSLPTVTLTPHSAGPTWDNWTKAYRNGFDNIQRVESGRAPFWVVPELR
jgi:phosphoglycerate dehydrogenase-like enzyme